MLVSTLTTLFATSFMPQLVKPAEASDVMYRPQSVLLWRGYKHTWETRNHRINELGSYLSMSNCDTAGCDGTAHHKADTGTASDVADFTTAYTEISSASAAFQSGYTNISITGSEGELIQGTTTVRVTDRNDLGDRDDYIVLLNGFNLESDTAAKKLDHLKVRVKNLEAAGGDLIFDVEYGLKSTVTASSAGPIAMWWTTTFKSASSW